MPDMRRKEHRRPRVTTWVTELQLLAQQVDVVCNQKLREYRESLGADWAPADMVAMIREGKAQLRPGALAYGPLIEQYTYPSKTTDDVPSLIAGVTRSLDEESLAIKQAFLAGDHERAQSLLARLIRWNVKSC